MAFPEKVLSDIIDIVRGADKFSLRVERKMDDGTPFTVVYEPQYAYTIRYTDKDGNARKCTIAAQTHEDALSAFRNEWADMYADAGNITVEESYCGILDYPLDEGAD